MEEKRLDNLNLHHEKLFKLRSSVISLAKLKKTLGLEYSVPHSLRDMVKCDGMGGREEGSIPLP